MKDGGTDPGKGVLLSEAVRGFFFFFFSMFPQWLRADFLSTHNPTEGGCAGALEPTPPTFRAFPREASRDLLKVRLVLFKPPEDIFPAPDRITQAPHKDPFSFGGLTFRRSPMS